MQSATPSHFATEFYAIKSDEVALVHAAASGVELLTQIVKLRGGRVIDRASTEDKAELARAAEPHRHRRSATKRPVPIGFPTFRDHVPTREALLSHSGQLFDWVESSRAASSTSTSVSLICWPMPPKPTSKSLPAYDGQSITDTLVKARNGAGDESRQFGFPSLAKFLGSITLLSASAPRAIFQAGA